MTPSELHNDAIVIDGLIIAKWNRELLEDMRSLSVGRFSGHGR